MNVGSTFTLEVNLPIFRCVTGGGEVVECRSQSDFEVAGDGAAARTGRNQSGGGRRGLRRWSGNNVVATKQFPGEGGDAVDMAYTSGLFGPSTPSSPLGNNGYRASPVTSVATAAWSFENDYRGMSKDLANGGEYYTDGADRAARTSMKRGSWEGQRAQVNPYNNIMGYPPAGSVGGGDRGAGGGGVNRQRRQAVNSITEEQDRSSWVEYAANNNNSGGVSRQPRVLLVDDDRLVRMVLGALLRRLGAVCETACHGIDAIEKVRAGYTTNNKNNVAGGGGGSGDAFDIIIMDVRMPQMNGLEATRVLPQQRVHGSHRWTHRQHVARGHGFVSRVWRD